LTPAIRAILNFTPAPQGFPRIGNALSQRVVNGPKTQKNQLAQVCAAGFTSYRMRGLY
jgi:hypothetical protein